MSESADRVRDLLEHVSDALALDAEGGDQRARALVPFRVQR